MTSKFFSKLLFLSLILLVLCPALPAQEQPQPAPQNQPAQEIMGEDDRLPFMQDQETQAAQEPTSGGLLLKTLGAMLLIVGLIFGGAWAAKKLGFGNFAAKDAGTDVDLAILTSVSLGSGRTISTVRFGDRVLLVGSTAQTFTLLAEELKTSAPELIQTRSVAEMLDDEDLAFEAEFTRAEARLELEDGGQI